MQGERLIQTYVSYSGIHGNTFVPSHHEWYISAFVRSQPVERTWFPLPIIYR